MDEYTSWILSLQNASNLRFHTETRKREKTEELFIDFIRIWLDLVNFTDASSKWLRQVKLFQATIYLEIL